MQRIIRCATHAERSHDAYFTPPVAVEALLRVEQLPYRVWEPAAGRGAIANVLRAHGHDVIAQDLVDYGVPGRLADATSCWSSNRRPTVTRSSQTRPFESQTSLSPMLWFWFRGW